MTFLRRLCCAAMIGVAAAAAATSIAQGIVPMMFVPRRADVRVSAGPSVGATINQTREEAYTIVVGNGGPAVAHRVQVSLQPNNIELLSSPTSSCTLPCAIPSIAIGTNYSFFVHFRAAGPGSYGFTAVAHAAEVDPDENINRALVDETATPQSDVPPTKQSVSKPVSTPTGTPTSISYHHHQLGEAITEPGWPPLRPRPHRTFATWLSDNWAAAAAGLAAVLIALAMTASAIAQARLARWLARLIVNPLPDTVVENGPRSLNLAAPALRVSASCELIGAGGQENVTIVREVRTR